MIRRSDMTAWGPGLPLSFRFRPSEDALLVRYGPRVHALLRGPARPQAPGERRVLLAIRRCDMTVPLACQWFRYERRLRLAALIRERIRSHACASIDAEWRRSTAIALATLYGTDPGTVDVAICALARELDVTPT